MQLLKTLLFTITILTSCLNSYAWWGKGHVSISQMAYEILPVDVKTTVDALSSLIYLNLPQDLQEQLQSTYPDPTLTDYARLSTMPDVWVHHTAQQFFNDFSATLPRNLDKYANSEIFYWHFVDIPYPKSYHCPQPTPPNVLWAIPALEEALEKTNDILAKGVILIFLSHIIEDCHQPLHTLTRVNAQCISDHGGNEYCIVAGKNNTCDLNLHSLLDSSNFFFNKDIPAQFVETELLKNHPKSSYTNQTLFDLNPVSWAQEGYNYAPFIYSTAQYNVPEENYLNKLQAICEERAALAAYRLSILIQKYFGAPM